MRSKHLAVHHSPVSVYCLSMTKSSAPRSLAIDNNTEKEKKTESKRLAGSFRRIFVSFVYLFERVLIIQFHKYNYLHVQYLKKMQRHWPNRSIVFPFRCESVEFVFCMYRFVCLNTEIGQKIRSVNKNYIIWVKKFDGSKIDAFGIVYLVSSSWPSNSISDSKRKKKVNVRSVHRLMGSMVSRSYCTSRLFFKSDGQPRNSSSIDRYELVQTELGAPKMRH